MVASRGKDAFASEGTEIHGEASSLLEGGGGPKSSPPPRFPCGVHVAAMESFSRTPALSMNVSGTVNVGAESNDHCDVGAGGFGFGPLDASPFVDASGRP